MNAYHLVKMLRLLFLMPYYFINIQLFLYISTQSKGRDSETSSCIFICYLITINTTSNRYINIYLVLYAQLLYQTNFDNASNNHYLHLEKEKTII